MMMLYGLQQLLFTVIFSIASQRTSCADNSSSSSVTSQLFSQYDKTSRPGYGGPPIVVSTSIFINSFANIEEASMQFKVYGYVRQYWRDSRLAGKISSTIILKDSDISNVWKPDAFCENARESNLHTPDEEISSLMFLDPDGSITYSRLTVITAECLMDLHNFPMDQQKCFLKFGSYSYSTKHIVYKWRPPVVVASKDLAQFQFKSLELSNVTDTFVTGNFSAIIVTFTFVRRLGYYLIQIYAPDIFLVMLSWIVFWMDRDDMGNRMALGITTILTIMFLLGTTNTAMPRVSYPKALDWFLMVSFTFVFFSLVECIFVYCIGPSQEGTEDKSKTKKSADPRAKCPALVKSGVRNRTYFVNPPVDEPTYKTGYAQENTAISLVSLATIDETPNGDTGIFRGGNNDNAEQENRKKTRCVAHWIDIVSRVLFPLGFVVYNIAYWCTYLL